MGHKVSPKTYRLGHTTNWLSKWFDLGSAYAAKIEQDHKIREFIFTKLRDGGVEKIEIERSRDSIVVQIYSSKPGIIIGRGGSGVEEVKNHLLKKIIKDKKVKLNLEIKEVNKPQLSAMIAAQNVAGELEKRIPYRRVMRRNVENIMKAGALGAKIICSGRLDGVEIARKETMYRGKVPLQTMRADIDYAGHFARTTYGAVGVKIWIYRGEVFEKQTSSETNNSKNSKVDNKETIDKK